MKTAEEAIAEMKQAFLSKDGPEGWLRQAREKLEGMVVKAIEDDDKEAEETARALVELHDLTTVAVQCVMVYKLTMDLCCKMEAKKSGLDAATWLGDWLMENKPQPQKRRVG